MRAVQAVVDGRADALVSGGSTGAALAASLFGFKRARGVHRPALAVVVPVPGAPFLLLDAGANVEVRPEHLVQFAHMGAAFMEVVMGMPRPARRAALQRRGARQGQRGRHRRPRAAHRGQGEGLNFVGNVEGFAVGAGAADVIVADGFTGNVALKVMEGTVDRAAGRGPRRGDLLDARQARRAAAAPGAARAARRARPGGRRRRRAARPAPPHASSRTAPSQTRGFAARDRASPPAACRTICSVAPMSIWPPRERCGPARRSHPGRPLRSPTSHDSRRGLRADPRPPGRRARARPGRITEQTHLREDLDADSLDLYSLVQELEDTYGVTMSDEQAAGIQTVAQAVDFVVAHPAATQAAAPSDREPGS